MVLAALVALSVSGDAGEFADVTSSWKEVWGGACIRSMCAPSSATVHIKTEVPLPWAQWGSQTH